MSVESKKRPKPLPTSIYGCYGVSLPVLLDGTIMVGDESSCWTLEELGLMEEQREKDKLEGGVKNQRRIKYARTARG